MLDDFLRILSVLGIILLVLLLLSLTIFLLVLFFPVTYRVYGSKDVEGLRISAKLKWLFGLLRANYRYPEPGHLVVKILWFTLYDAKIPADRETEDGEKSGRQSKNAKAGRGEGAEQTAQTGQERPEGQAEAVAQTSAAGSDAEAGAQTGQERPEGQVEAGAQTGQERPEGQAEAGAQTSAAGSDDKAGAHTNSDSSEEGAPDADATPEINGKISQKIEKIKYTIRNIYDKIKEIWENISYYAELLREENTKQLFSHACLRTGKILKSIRPRHIKADILFGTGSPDTTGYAYGVYGMLSPALGPKFLVTPDFEQAVFKGEFDVSGHITICIILINGLKLLLDKRLQEFMKKMKAGKGR